MLWCTEVGGSEHTWCFCEELRIGVLLWDMVFDRNAMMVNSKITSSVVCIKNAVRKFSLLFTSHMRNACGNIDIIVGWFHSIIQDQKCIPNGGNEGVSFEYSAKIIS